MLDEIRRFTGNDFQVFASVLLSAHDPDFQAVYGEGGDSGNDGFNVAGDTVYQMYGPKRTATASQVRKKIAESIGRVVQLRSGPLPSIAHFVMVTNFDLTERMHRDLRESACGAGIAQVRSWGQTRLAQLLARHSEIRNLFPDILLPDIAAELRKINIRAEARDQSNSNIMSEVASPFTQLQTLESENGEHVDGYQGIGGSEALAIAAYERRAMDKTHPPYPVGQCYWSAVVESVNLRLPSMEPRYEDFFVEAVESMTGGQLHVDSRDAFGVILRDGSRRSWGRGVSGTLSARGTLPTKDQTSYDVTELCRELAIFLQLAAQLGVEGKAEVTFAFNPDRLECIDTPPLITDVRTPRRSSDFEARLALRFRDMAEHSAEVAASFVSQMVRQLHQARIDSDELGKATSARLPSSAPLGSSAHV